MSVPTSVDSTTVVVFASTEHTVFLHGEGPRSRCYGRTTALRLFVQPCDEDEDEDEQFLTKFSK
jgi:hypothetical protein